jgi:hypothetical protein
MISVLTIGLTLVRLFVKILMAMDFLNYQIVQSLALGRNGVQTTSSVPQDSESGNCKSGDLNPDYVANVEIS